MAKKKTSLLEKFVSGLAEAGQEVYDRRPGTGGKKPPTKVSRGAAKPDPSMLGTGMASKAGRALKGRGRQLQAQEEGIIGY